MVNTIIRNLHGGDNTYIKYLHGGNKTEIKAQPIPPVAQFLYRAQVDLVAEIPETEWVGTNYWQASEMTIHAPHSYDEGRAILWNGSDTLTIRDDPSGTATAVWDYLEIDDSTIYNIIVAGDNNAHNYLYTDAGGYVEKGRYSPGLSHPFNKRILNFGKFSFICGTDYIHMFKINSGTEQIEKTDVYVNVAKGYRDMSTDGTYLFVASSTDLSVDVFDVSEASESFTYRDTFTPDTYRYQICLNGILHFSNPLVNPYIKPYIYNGTELIQQSGSYSTVSEFGTNFHGYLATDFTSSIFIPMGVNGAHIIEYNGSDYEVRQIIEFPDEKVMNIGVSDDGTILMIGNKTGSAGDRMYLYELEE